MTEPMNEEPGRWQTFGERTIAGGCCYGATGSSRTGGIRQLLITAGPGQ